MQKFFYALIKDSPQQKALYDASRTIHEERLANKPELVKALTPTWQSEFHSCTLEWLVIV